jgi:3-hydroxyisobutyrate dehydrogenase-like beta-hydroxyacid dehydrogenase
MGGMESQVSVSVLGLGAMGSALAQTFLRQGRRTVVWNRSGAKAEPLVQHGAHAVATPAEAISASPVIVVCVLDYSAAKETLSAAADRLRGRTIVNLTNGRPQEARAFAQWAAEHGADYLDGGIMAVPPMIGQREALILYSGSENAYHSHRSLLELLGSSRYLGPDAGRAALHDLALLSGMYGMFAGTFQALALVTSDGVKATEFIPLLVDWLKAMAVMLPDYARQIDARDYTLDVVANAGMQTESLRNIVRACREQGVSPGLLEPLLQHFERWIAAGHGAEDITGVVELITAPATAETTAHRAR